MEDSGVPPALVPCEVVFFLDEQQQLQLVDFVYVILINLGVSLAISLFFIPALLDRFPLPRPAQNRGGKTKRRFVKGYRFYGNTIARLYRFRVWILLVALLGFGIPTFLLPANWNGENWYHQAYNATLGSETYNKNVRPVVDKALGGSLRLFPN